MERWAASSSNSRRNTDSTYGQNLMRATIRAARPFLNRLSEELMQLLSSHHQTLLRKISAASLHWASTRLSAQPAGSIIFPRSAKLLQADAHTAALFAKHGEYEAWGWEIHHSAKKDAPSGTLKKLAEEMRANGYTRPVSLSS